MAKVELRPTLPDDLPHIIGESLPCRIRAVTVLVDGRIIGMGGLAFPPAGPAIAFVQRTNEARRYPVTIHRAGLMAMRMMRECGVAQVIATADAASETAIRWLHRLGFKPAASQHIDGKCLFVWEP